MPFVRMRRDFSYDLEGGRRRTIPAGWAGNLSDEVAKKAEEAGAVAKDPNRGTAPKTAQPAPAAEGGSTSAAASEEMTREELDKLATDAGLKPGDYANKAAIVEAINAA